MRNRCYLVDENTTPALADQLRRRQPSMDVLTIGDGIAPPKGTLDPDILLWLEEHDYSLIIHERERFLPVEIAEDTEHISIYRNKFLSVERDFYL